MKVSLKEANMRATPKTCSPSLTAGPRVTFSSFGSLTFLLDCTTSKIKARNPIRIAILHSQTNHRVLHIFLKETLRLSYMRISDLRTMMKSFAGFAGASTQTKKIEALGFWKITFNLFYFALGLGFLGL